MTLAHDPYASPTRAALGARVGEAVDGTESSPNEPLRPSAAEAAPRLAARYHASRMVWMLVIAPLSDVPRGTNGRCARALVVGAIEHSESSQHSGSIREAGGSRPEVFHVEHPRPGYLASRGRATTGVAAGRPGGNYWRITGPPEADARGPHGGISCGRTSALP